MSHEKGKQHAVVTEDEDYEGKRGTDRHQRDAAAEKHAHHQKQHGVKPGTDDRPKKAPLPPRQREPERLPDPDSDGDEVVLKVAKPAPAAPPRPLPRDPVPYVVGSRPDLEEGIRRGTHVVATLKILKWTGGLAYGSAPSWLPRDVALHGFEARGAALPGDVVVIELDPIVSWKNVSNNNQGPGVDYKPVGFGSKKAADINLSELQGPQPMSEVEDVGGDEAAAAAGGGHHHTGRAVAFDQTVKRVLDYSDVKSAPRPVNRICTECGAVPPTSWNPKLQPSGKVVAVLERRFHEFQACRLFGYKPEQLPIKVYADKYYKFKPYDETYPIVTLLGADIPDNFRAAVHDYLLLLEVPLGRDNVSVELLGGQPRARVVMSLGMSSTADAESRAIAAMYQVRDFEFSDEIEACVIPDFVIPSKDELKAMGRRDLREEEFVCTIDPATARDLDDALSITKTDGGYRVGVHIADVSYFVPVGTPLDDEARMRCTSTYFVERVIPMLPRKLSEDYCSLNAGTDKFAFSCIFNFDNNGVLTSEWFGQSVIRNRCRMAYGDAQLIIDGNLTGDSLVFHESELVAVPREALVKDVVTSVLLLNELAEKLRTRRFKNGALSLNKRKLYFFFEDMNSRLAPKGFALDSTKKANWLVEEFMLYANIRTATKVTEFMPDAALLRRHDPPVIGKLNEFLRAARKHGFYLSGRGSKALNDSLDKYRDHPDSDTLRLMATYCLALAKYTCSGDDEKQQVAHYALATPLYTHFTSPIRRYCDLIVHRQLLLALEIEQLHKAGKPIVPESLRYRHFLLSKTDCQDICDHANDRKEAARKAGEASMKMFFCLYLNALRQKSTVDPTIEPVQKCKATVTRVKNDRFSIYCPQIALDTEIFLNSQRQRWVGADFPETDEEGGEAKADKFEVNWGLHQGREIKEQIGLFSELEVALEVVVAGCMQLNMILSPPWERRPTSAVLQAFPPVPDQL